MIAFSPLDATVVFPGSCRANPVARGKEVNRVQLEAGEVWPVVGESGRPKEKGNCGDSVIEKKGEEMIMVAP